MFRVCVCVSACLCVCVFAEPENKQERADAFAKRWGFAFFCFVYLSLVLMFAFVLYRSRRGRGIKWCTIHGLLRLLLFCFVCCIDHQLGACRETLPIETKKENKKTTLKNGKTIGNNLSRGAQQHTHSHTCVCVCVPAVRDT